ncbi:hypothetical protein CORC01_12451 [Colletotrichum orchidophilum]|uniref:Uncharacterized protein n=1 Tax=Colletotrichum orchidophilum TaxID=1209926 RepID=A0A1G4ASX3_9PEZI|nr:uncharacterized protein CORC01_12451 [Colletotrichum orchidophilum]OHE92215.1 hypothetical protein CORC01_12451 [Colletotrichum orchidophilum]
MPFNGQQNECSRDDMLMIMPQKPAPYQSHQSRHKEVPSDYNNIQPLDSFDFAKTEPIQLRPWKPKFHLTMGLENATFSDILPLDNTLVDRLALRRRVVAQHREMVTSANPCSESAVKEFYIWLVRTYLPRRYPDIYTCGEDMLFGPESTAMPTNPPDNVRDVLGLIAENVDAEFFFLQRQGDSYVARAIINCYPFTFNPAHKLNKTLAQIHGPIPGYAIKLQKSMDRYFASLAKGKLAKRHNWNIALDRELFSPTKNPLTFLPVPVMEKIKDALEWLGIGFPKIKSGEVDAEQVTLRCERQTLHRMMENEDTLVFSFKTYQYPLRQIRDEGGGPALAEAIRGIKSGSVPQIEWYKASMYWADAVVDYLLTEDSI